MKECIKQFKSLKLTENLMEEYKDYKQKINHLINEIKRIKEQIVKYFEKILTVQYYKRENKSEKYHLFVRIWSYF